MNAITGVIINDCADDNARSRQEVRFESLFGAKPTFLGVGSYLPVEAAGNLLDVLDVLTNFPLADTERQSVVLVNVAPRHRGEQSAWDNGTPFCYFWLGKTLVVSTYEGECLAIVRDLGIVQEVSLLDTQAVTAAAVAWGDLTPAEADKITHSQFRSLEFTPLVAYWLLQGKPVPSTPQTLKNLPSAQGAVWLVDNFDDVKTTLLPVDVGFADGKQVKLVNGHLATCYRRLVDVPEGVTALTIGSSGFGPYRFLEVVIGHCGRAGKVHGFTVGDPVLWPDDQSPKFGNSPVNR
ncbi:MAG TPA: hypothetical protein VLF91_04755 [Candidatus Saccharimonadales bacterium]|nr:hypothetical protein [Candidatus Saccharimonadales bacterium]